ncbi:hypothetical protein LCGC14_0196380 [marine sediment metagenome]|uniref:Uncharacterized protein n=1 Tax=marine sediment metagenome TaxID=412755 RepID=A0A0F9UKP5_9ZZZZ
MPYYGGLLLGYQVKTELEANALFEKMGIRSTDYERFKSLRDVQLNILELISTHSREQLETIVEDSTKGQRKYKISELTFCAFGSSELEDIYPQDFVFGVELISRYFPILLDWQLEHGGTGEAFEINDKVLIQVITELRKVMPDAQLFIKTEFA